MSSRAAQSLPTGCRATPTSPPKAAALARARNSQLNISKGNGVESLKIQFDWYGEVLNPYSENVEIVSTLTNRKHL